MQNLGSQTCDIEVRIELPCSQLGLKIWALPSYPVRIRVLTDLLNMTTTSSVRKLKHNGKSGYMFVKFVITLTIHLLKSLVVSTNALRIFLLFQLLK